MTDKLETCRSCQTAAHVLRRIGFRDNISWGVMGGPTKVLHATHANAGHTIERQETDKEYQRRLESAREHGAKEVKPLGQIIRDHTLLPLCNFYSQELAWLSAGRPTRTTVYMAHPVAGADFHDNVRNATIWLRYLRRLGASEINALIGSEYQQRPLVLCPWLAAIEDDDMYPGGREGVISDARDTVLMFDEVWLVGGRISDGMKVEASTARVLRDLTHLGTLPSPFRQQQPETNGVRKTKRR